MPKASDSVTMHGVDQLRRMTNVFNNCREDFNHQFTLEQLVQLYRMYQRCGWDITPDRWTEGQVSAALCGTIPRWDNDETPIEEGE